MNKKLFSLFLVLCVLMMVPVTALADEPGDPSEPTAAPTTELLKTPGSSTTTELHGTIAATQIKVTVPTNIAFTIDPTVEAEAPRTQISAGTADITNESLVPVYVAVSEVSVDEESGVVLVQTEDDLEEDKTVMLAYKQEDEVKDFDTEDDWLVEGDLDYYPINSQRGRIAARTLTTEDEDGEPLLTAQEKGTTVTVEVSGKTINGWHADDTFTVTPVIVVTVVAPEPTSY